MKESSRTFLTQSYTPEGISYLNTFEFRSFEELRNSETELKLILKLEFNIN